mgnify:CR=1 FL=1
MLSAVAEAETTKPMKKLITKIVIEVAFFIPSPFAIPVVSYCKAGAKTAKKI